ncbi:MAG TPA: glutathione S-transferase family protein [Steroidobacteraceae bacterium]|nr:glutathione S-transferase family protein [Steroidobacteraceae bacterium]
MSLQLFLHPLSSYCHKVLTAFYENDIPFEVKRVDDPVVGREWLELSPMRKFPLLRDPKRGQVIPESTIIIEYLDLHYPGRTKLIPRDPDLAWQVRLRDRFFDNYLHTAVQTFAGDHLRPKDKKDPYGVDQAKAMFVSALGAVEAEMADRTWAMADTFTLADCAAAPALFYGNRFFGPFHQTHPNANAYLERLMARPSYARALEEAKPFFNLLPK